MAVNASFRGTNRHWRQGTIALSMLLLWGAMGAKAANFYVDPSGDDGNPGTIAEPFQTVQAAVEQAGEGDVLHLRGGTYRELVRPGPSNTGVAGNQITIRAYDPDGDGPLVPEEVTVSGFEPLIPGQEINAGDFVGNWELFDAALGIWRIQLSKAHGLANLPSGVFRRYQILEAGRNQVIYDGEVLRRERFPSERKPYGFDYRAMAAAEEGSKINFPSGQEGVYGIHPATYKLASLPPGDWTGAGIHTSAGRGVITDQGVITSSGPGTLSFNLNFKGAANELNQGDPFFLYNHLLALDEPGEAFLDVDGDDGEHPILYLIPPDGGTPADAAVELRVKRQHPSSPTQFSNEAFWFVGGVSSYSLEDFTILGARIFAGTNGTPSKDIDLLRMTILHGATSGLAVSQAIADCDIEGCRLESSFGFGIKVGDRGVVKDCVISDTLESGVFTGGIDLTVENNTVYNVGGIGITINGKNSRYRFNNVFQNCLWRTDVGGLNTCSQGDLQGTEVAYNMAHSSFGRVSGPLLWSGSVGIRMDSGCSAPGTSNFILHHNLVYRVSSRYQLVVWSLLPSFDNYGNSMALVYNNTVERDLAYSGAGSMGGHDIRNNIAAGFWAKEGVVESASLYQSNLFTDRSYPLNLTGVAKYSLPAVGDFSLLEGSPALDSGELIGPYTDGFMGSAPDMGAFESGVTPWVAGARIRVKDYPGLSVQQSLDLQSRRVFRVVGMPVGRMLPIDSQLSIGGSQNSTGLFHEIGSDGHVEGVRFDIDTESLEGSHPVTISFGGGEVVSLGTVELLDGGADLSAVDPPVTSLLGGTTHSVSGAGFVGSSMWLMPIRFTNLSGLDFSVKPVPVIVNTQFLIEEGRMEADGRDLRIIEYPVNLSEPPRELEYWVESGLGTSSTLIWVRNPGGTASLGGAIYLSSGNPALAGQSDPNVLTDYYDELKRPSLELALRADSLSTSMTGGELIENWPDVSGFGHDGAQSVEGKRPEFEPNVAGGLPGIKFDGIDDYLFVGPGIGPDKPVSIFVVYWNPDPFENFYENWEDIPSQELNQRLASSNHYPTNDFQKDSASNTYGLAHGASIVDQAIPLPSRSDFPSAGIRNFDEFTIGANYRWRDNVLYGNFFRGYICEMLVFTEQFKPNFVANIHSVREYLDSKWELEAGARGAMVLGEALPPFEVWVGDQRVFDFTILDDSTIEFVAPPADGNLDENELPASFDVSLRRGESESILVDALIYQPEGSGGIGGLDPFVDNDDDGLLNIFEYLYNTDPHVADLPGAIGPALLTTSGEEQLVFRQNKNIGDLLVRVAVSSDLVNWTSYDLWELENIVLDADVDGDGETRLVGVTLPEADCGFVRLEVELIETP